MSVARANFEEVGRIDLQTSDLAATTVTCRIENQTSFTARVVLLAHRHHDLDERRALVPGGKTIPIACPTGQVVILVFNADTDAFYQGRILNVSGSFTFPIL